MSKPSLMCHAALAAAVGALLAAGCRPEIAVDIDGNPAPDAPDGLGCTTLSPRAVAPETFIGPIGLEARMLDMIDGAQSSLDIHMYLFTVTTIAHRIVSAKNRGITVRVLLDPDHEGNRNVTPILTSGGVNWKLAPTLYTFAHAKYVIVDRSAAVIMSMNWNIDAMRSERNYGIVDRDPEDVADVQAIFDQDWAMATGQTAQPADLDCTRLVVSPNNAKQRLLEHIGSATQTLDLELMYLSETSIRDAVGSAQMRGVTVRALLSDASGNEVAYLQNLGIPVRVAESFYVHSKLIIADDVAFVGSENMSFTSLTKNREVGALVFEPSAFAPIQAQFDTDWAGARPL
jgi:phosphatidylserine/phosphatidylglycerophosphate/cardiolipin synthase-like enzyme